MATPILAIAVTVSKKMKRAPSWWTFQARRRAPAWVPEPVVVLAGVVPVLTVRLG
ncbi:MAG: hypothetical protein WBX27_02705 [Specibacter sp.]